jgi:hypothetical protein
MEVSGQLQASAALLPGKETPVTTGWDAGWAPVPFWTQCRGEKFPGAAGIRTPVIRSYNPIYVQGRTPRYSLDRRLGGPKSRSGLFVEKKNSQPLAGTRTPIIWSSNTLYPQGKSPLYPFDRRVDGPQSWSGHGVKEKNSQPPPGFEPRSSDHPTCFTPRERDPGTHWIGG